MSATQVTSFSPGTPAYLFEASVFVSLVDPSTGIKPGESLDREGRETNLPALYQRCTHVGCKPNFCGRNFWFECPCRGSRIDRLEKVKILGPAASALDRFAHMGRGQRRDHDGPGQDYPGVAADRAEPARPDPAADSDRLPVERRPACRRAANDEVARRSGRSGEELRSAFLIRRSMRAWRRRG